jgi:hypothetical protein
MAGAVGSADGLDQEVIGVGLATDFFARGFEDIAVQNSGADSCHLTVA